VPDCSAEQQALTNASAAFLTASQNLTTAQANYNTAFATLSAAIAAYEACMGNERHQDSAPAGVVDLLRKLAPVLEELLAALKRLD
jgi:hypothetical protein